MKWFGAMISKAQGWSSSGLSIMVDTRQKIQRFEALVLWRVYGQVLVEDSRRAESQSESQPSIGRDMWHQIEESGGLSLQEILWYSASKYVKSGASKRWGSLICESTGAVRSSISTFDTPRVLGLCCVDEKNS
jgi:hypothetical protein